MNVFEIPQIEVTDDTIKIIQSENIPWGKVLGKRMTTDRWKYMPISIWKSVWVLITRGAWERTEFRLLTPMDKEFDPEPYEQTLIL